MKIFSLLPAYSNPQTNNIQKSNNSQRPQAMPKLGALTHDQVSFMRDIEIKDLDDVVRIVYNNDLTKFFPELKKSEKKYIIDLLKCKILQKPVTIRLFARQKKGSSPELVVQFKHKKDSASWKDIPISRSDIISANDLNYDTFRSLINKKMHDFREAQE